MACNGANTPHRVNGSDCEEGRPQDDAHVEHSVYNDLQRVSHNGHADAILDMQRQAHLSVLALLRAFTVDRMIQQSRCANSRMETYLLTILHSNRKTKTRSATSIAQT